MYQSDTAARSQWTDRILYLIVLDFAKCGEILRPIAFAEKKGLFHNASVHCFTECHQYATETLQWTMQFVLQCYFFEVGCLFWIVYKCAQLQAKRAKWTKRGMISVEDLTRCALCAIGGRNSPFFFYSMNGLHFAHPHPHPPGN